MAITINLDQVLKVMGIPAFLYQLSALYVEFTVEDNLFKFFFDLLSATAVLVMTALSYYWLWSKNAQLNSTIRYGNVAIIGLQFSNVAILSAIGVYRIIQVGQTWSEIY